MHAFIITVEGRQMLGTNLHVFFQVTAHELQKSNVSIVVQLFTFETLLITFV